MKVSGSIAAALQRQLLTILRWKDRSGVHLYLDAHMQTCERLSLMRSGTLHVRDGTLCAEVHEGELLKELPQQLRTDIVSHVLRDIFNSSHLFAVCAPYMPAISTP